jgi:hypothetical protein
MTLTVRLLFSQAIVAKQLHFAFAAPSMKKAVFRDQERGEEDELQRAPRQCRDVGWSRPGSKDVAGIAVNLAAAFDSLLSEA